MLPFFTGVFRDCSVGKADLKDELTKVIGNWGWKGSVDELMDYWLTKGTQIDQELLEYVKSLHDTGLRCFMATDQEKYRGEHLQKIVGNGQVFERVFYSAQAGSSKKNQAFWEFVFQEVSGDLKPVECFFTDDDQVNVEAVASFGIDSFLYTDFESLKKRLEENRGV